MKKLIPAIVLLLISAMIMATASYAWFSMNTTVTATGMQIRAKSNATFLLIGESTLATADAIQAQTGADLTSEALTVADDDADVYPSKPWLNDTEDGYSGLTSMTVVNNKTTAAVVGNWYTANSNDSTVWGGSSKVIGAAALTDFANYVIVRSVNLTLSDGSTKSNNLTVTPTILPKGLTAATGDASGKAQSGKTYYSKSGSVFTKETVTVGSTEVTSFYDKTTEASDPETYDISAVKVLVVSDNNQVVILDSSMNGSPSNLYGATNTDLTDTTVHKVDIYIFYDGTETVVRTNNIANLGDASIDLQFDVEVNE